jgi:hypothetical protein
MKHWIIGVSLVLGVFFIAPTPVAHAWSWSSFFGRSADGQGKDHAAGKKHPKRWSYGKTSKRSNSAVPELDAGAAGSAVVLLLGGVAYIVSRRREQEDVA